MKTGRFDMGGMLGWEKPHSDIFRKFLAHENLVKYLHLVVGKGYRLDHSPLCIAQNKGSEGFSLHGGSIEPGSEALTPDIMYVCKNNTMWNTLIATSFFLTDQNPGDGGFCVVPGSHKINFAPSLDMINGEDEEFYRDYVQQPQCKAGDVVIFSEATIHGCLPWIPDRQRRIALYRFSPSNCGYARGYTEPNWPESYTEGMTEEQLAVMMPPFTNRFDRPYLGDDAKVQGVSSRSQLKKDFDQ